MTKEEFLKAIESVPKTDRINPISAYNSINVQDLANAVDRLKKVPTYDELLEENQKYKEVIDKAINDLDIIIDIVREQPLGSCWIINRLEANKGILKEVK